MPLHRRLTARNALLALLTWLFVALVLHLKAELWDQDAAPASWNDSDHVAQHEDPVENAQVEPGSATNELSGSGLVEKRKTAVVVASQTSENATWLDEYFPQWEKNIYRVDDPSGELRVPKNKGRESMVYLT